VDLTRTELKGVTMHWDVLQSSVIPQARTNEYETYRAAPTCVPRRCQEEREKVAEEVQYIGVPVLA